MEGRIRHIQALLEKAEIVDTDTFTEVQAGSVVEIRYEGEGEGERYLLGSIEERHSELDVISPGSPLGQALLGAKPGDMVEFAAPTGATIRVEVLGIE